MLSASSSQRRHDAASLSGLLGRHRGKVRAVLWIRSIGSPEKIAKARH
jgi:hypothetical protein